MIRNMSDPLYKKVFRAQAAAQIMAAPYIQRNIETAVAHLRDLFPNTHPPQIQPTFIHRGCKSSVEVIDSVFAYRMNAETLFELCEPSSISIDGSLEYRGTYLYELPGVTARATLYAKVSDEDVDTLRCLGHVTTVAGDFYHTITCETRHEN